MDSQARFEALYLSHCGAVRGFIHRRVPAAAADDVVADVFVVVWRRLDETPDDPLPWLLGIARGVIANRRRGEVRMSALLDRLMLAYGAVSIPQTATRVRDTHSGTDAAIVSENHFAIALHPVGNDWGDYVHLKAFDAAGRPLATQDKPLPDTPITNASGDMTSDANASRTRTERHTPEIAELLFVTRKTVELHLGNTFGKLGIRSRTQLPAILTERQTGDAMTQLTALDPRDQAPLL